MRIRNNAHYGSNDKLIYDQLISSQETIEELAMKLGSFTLILGLLLFFNFFIMLLMQRPKRQVQQVPFTINEPNK